MWRCPKTPPPDEVRPLREFFHLEGSLSARADNVPHDGDIAIHQAVQRFLQRIVERDDLSGLQVEDFVDSKRRPL